MKKNKSFLGSVFLVSLVLTGIQAFFSGMQAQQAITSAGGDASGSGGTVGYSVGQVFYITATGTSGTVAPGVQQAYKIEVISGVDDTGPALKCSVFPNPASDRLTISVENAGQAGLRFQLSDMGGRLIESRMLEGTLTGLDMNGLASSTYFLKIISDNQVIKVYKIIKK